MKKDNNKGFMLAETLVVTAFVAGVLIFLYIQFTNLNKSYQETYIYNTVEGLYALEDVKTYIENNSYVYENIDELNYIDITDCTFFTNQEYCEKLYEVENIKAIFITHNEIPKEDIKKEEGYNKHSESFKKFISKINKEGVQPYRIVAEFNNSTYATIRFGDYNE